MDILNKIQKELKAPKGQRNSFGNYNYRSCEDILEAVKPLLGDATLIIEDEIVMLGDRFYVKATAKLYGTPISSGTANNSCYENNLIASAAAYAREPLEKKGMDAAQITGATSSYARKYALNGLFCIDDTKDADSTNKHDDIEPTKTVTKKITPAEAKANARKAIESSNNLDVLMEVEQNIKKSKNLSSEDKEELAFLADERRMAFDPTA